MRLLLAISLFLVSTLSNAEIQKQAMEIVCGPTEAILNTIKNEHKENVVWIGTEDKGVVVSTWMNGNKNTFSILKTTANGKMTCLIAAGVIPTTF